MTSPWRKFTLWLQRRRKEDELREELQFHLEEEASERQADGLAEDQARYAAHRDLGNVTLVRENTRELWSWVLVEQLAQDIRYGLRSMIKNRMFTALAALSLALGIGANTAIYSFMDSILLRSLPVSDPASLVVFKWQSKPATLTAPDDFVLHSIDGATYRDASGVSAAIFPFPAFEGLREASAPLLSSLFAHKPAGRVNVMIRGEAELAQGEYVSGDFFRGLAVLPAAGRLILADDDRIGAASVAVLSKGYSERRFGDAASAIGQHILINNVPFTVVGVAPAEFFGVDPAAAPQVFLPMYASFLFDPGAGKRFADQNYYWVEMMGRLRPGVDLAQAQTALAGAFAHWVAPTATSDAERANLPVLRLEEGAGGLDSLRRQVLEAALGAADDGGPDPGDRVREHGESPAGAGGSSPPRDSRAAQPGRGTLARRASTPDRERPPGITQRCPRHPHRRRRHSCADGAAGERAGRIHAARRAELACARRHAGAVVALRSACSAWLRRCSRPGRR